MATVVPVEVGEGGDRLLVGNRLHKDHETRDRTDIGEPVSYVVNISGIENAGGSIYRNSGAGRKSDFAHKLLVCNII